MDDIEIRELKPKDSTDLWTIRNTESVRHMSNNTEPILREAHDAWFARYVTNPRNHGFVVVCDGRVAGYCRIDDGLVSIAIAPEFQGRGFSKRLLVESVRRVQQVCDHIIAEVRRDNTVSIRLFEAAGFGVTEQDPEKFVFSFPPPALDIQAKT